MRKGGRRKNSSSNNTNNRKIREERTVFVTVSPLTAELGLPACQKHRDMTSEQRQLESNGYFKENLAFKAILLWLYLCYNCLVLYSVHMRSSPISVQ